MTSSCAESVRGGVNGRGLAVLLAIAISLIAPVRGQSTSGCTDSAASNYDAAAGADDGSCAYDCAALRAVLGLGAADCLVFNGSRPESAERWPAELRSRGAAECRGGLQNVALADDDAWVVQGRPSAGVQPGQADDRLVTALPYRFLVDGARLAVRYVRMSGSCASLGEGGYIRANNSAVVTVEKVFFGGAGGSAPAQGGAIFAVSSTVSVRQSRFDRLSNGVSAGSCSLSLSDVAFIAAENGQNGASMLRVYTPDGARAAGGPQQSTLLVDTTFSPWSSTAVSDTSGWNPTAGDCEEHPCDPGFSCSFEHYSLRCTPCRAGTQSEHGLTCEQCQPGEEPVQGQTNCQACTGDTYSADGVKCRDDCPRSSSIIRRGGSECAQCPEGQGPNSNRTQCERCPAGRFSSDGACRDCAAPTVSHSDRTRCVLCAPGKEPRGSERADREQEGCKPCTGKSFSSFGVQCQPCASPGTPNDGHTACNTGNAITVCPPGEGMVNGACQACEAGQYSSYGTNCVECTGDNNVALERTRCEKCPPRSGFLNQTACEPCQPPRYSPGSGAPCEDCDPPSIVVEATGKCSAPAPGQVYNADRTGFVRCDPGSEPAQNRSVCLPCAEMMLSRTGVSCNEKCRWDPDRLKCSSAAWSTRSSCRRVITQLKAGSNELTCKLCEEGQQPNADHSACVAACPARCSQCSSDGKVCHQCDARGGYYNSSEKLIVCFGTPDRPEPYYDNATVHQLRVEYSNDKETDGHCQSVPSCVQFDAAGEIEIQPGFSAVRGTDELGEVWSVFACPQTERGPQNAGTSCAGGRLPAVGDQHNCTNLHDGPLCRECEDNCRGASGKCESCQAWYESVIDINLVRTGVIIAVMCALLAVFHVWEFSDRFSIRTLKRGGVYATVEVFIGFCQIATLFVSVSSEFESVIEKLPFKEEYLSLLSVVSLNVPAWLSLDCLADDFYTKWAFKAVGVPLMCFGTVGIKYHYYKSGRRCCKSERLELHESVVVHVAKQQRSADIQLALFVSYTSVFNSVLHVMICKQISPTRSVLEDDNTITCDDGADPAGSDTHQRYQYFALGLTLFLVMVPVRALWYALALPRRTRLTSPCKHKQGLEPWKDRLTDAFEIPDSPFAQSTRQLRLKSESEPEPEPEPELEPEPEPEPEATREPAALQRLRTAPATGLVKQYSEGANSKAALQAENRLLMDEKRQLANEELAKKERELEERRHKLIDVEKLVERFRHADVLKLMAAEPTAKFRPPRSFWRKPCSTKTVVDDLTSLDKADWVTIHRVVRRAEQPLFKLVLEELMAKNDGSLGQDPWNVVAILVQHFSGAELTLLVSNEKAYSVPKKIKEINEAVVAAGRPRITKKEWETVHGVVAALSEDSTFTEGHEYYRAVDFLRKLLVLCCAFLPSDVARPMFAAFVSLGFAFLHIRVWPYRRQETNVHKMITDFTICFVFYLCSIKAAGEPSGDWMFDGMQQVVIVMWQILVPLSLVVACVAGVRRERRTLRDQLRNEMEEGGELYGLSKEAQEDILASVSSFSALAWLDEQTWWHRKVLCVRRRSSMRERLLCTCEDETLRARCVEARVMECRTNDHDILHNCRKIPWPWQDEVDKLAHNADLSDADREKARLGVRAMDQLRQLKDQVANWADIGLSAEGNEAMRESVRASVSEPFPELEAAGQDRCGCCKRKAKGEPLRDSLLADVEGGGSLRKSQRASEREPEPEPQPQPDRSVPSSPRGRPQAADPDDDDDDDGEPLFATPPPHKPQFDAADMFGGGSDAGSAPAGFSVQSQ